ncbi:xanthine dehydrogenase family protein molybdopterin-binding subunit [Nonomuraea typhae]|uniref:xanthine dehydrogenase family protein molybdopterin-binding subunit n=1 Tax=Nonomuraea typhae TaxID=2603600 RepID=UPI0015E2467D|nr:xanthine dehydrogenase family protein molybdopterin-binding subunit [Nonomuraea typhae]
MADNDEAAAPYRRANPEGGGEVTHDPRATNPTGNPPSPRPATMNREDGPLKVTGRARYAADHTPARLAHGYLLTSTVAKGTILAMDVPAEAPGVLAVYSPFNPLKLHPYAREENAELTPPIQSPEIRYHGQAIGLVVAETFEQARDAAARVRVRYDTQPPRASFPGGLPAPIGGTPVTDILEPGIGSIDEALTAGAVTVTATYTTPAETHAALEPHATLASWTGDHLTVHTASQGVRLVVDRLSETLGIEADKIHVINPYVGGGFGNKWGMWAHTPLTAAAARALGRPVKTVLTREQTCTVVGHRPFTRQTVSLGAAADGTLVAVKNDGVSSKSASNGFHEPAANLSLILYGSRNLHVSRSAVTLDVPCGTIMRAPQESNGSFALESAMDELAAELGIDPLDLRLKNNTPIRQDNRRPWSGKHLDECYRLGAALFGWPERDPVPGRRVEGDWLVGYGMATATHGASRGQAAIKVRLLSDGTATVSGTAADLGTGQSTVFVMLAADVLGIPAHRITPSLGDSSAPPAANAGGSGSTSTNGPAVLLAAEDATRTLLNLAASHPRSPFAGHRVTYARGTLRGGGIAMPFGAFLTDIETPAVEALATSPRNSSTTHAFRSFGAHFCEVRVHRWTAEPRVTRWVCTVDAGRIVNEKTARSQIAGGIVMGIGQALLENLHLDPSTARFTNATLADYLIPAGPDVPPMDIHFLNHPDTLLSDLGARGIGELGIVGTAAAIANAVHNATGIRVRDLPITPDKLLD